MPNRIRDPYSGAVLFVPTEEEKRIAALEARVANLENKADVAPAAPPLDLDKDGLPSEG